MKHDLALYSPGQCVKAKARNFDLKAKAKAKTSNYCKRWKNLPPNGPPNCNPLSPTSLDWAVAPLAVHSK